VYAYFELPSLPVTSVIASYIYIHVGIRLDNATHLIYISRAGKVEHRIAKSSAVPNTSLKLEYSGLNYCMNLLLW